MTKETPHDGIDVNLIREARVGLGSVLTDFVAHQKEEGELLQKSIMEGGPSSRQEAFLILMSYFDIGGRTLAQKAGISRTKLKRMLGGEIQMPPEIHDRIQRAFYQASVAKIKSTKGEVPPSLISIRDSLKPE